MSAAAERLLAAQVEHLIRCVRDDTSRGDWMTGRTSLVQDRLMKLIRLGSQKPAERAALEKVRDWHVQMERSLCKAMSDEGSAFYKKGGHQHMADAISTVLRDLAVPEVTV